MIKQMKIIFLMIILGGLLVACNSTKVNRDMGSTALIANTNAAVDSKANKTFTNPIIDKPSADPWIIYVDGYYYYTYSTGSSIGIKKVKELQALGQAKGKIVWTAPPSGSYSKNVWAPELHYVNERWYIYFAADDGNNVNHRMYVLEGGTNANKPLRDKYRFKAKISDKTDKWAIDGTVLQQDDGLLYFIWSGWEGDVDGKQNIYIAPMSNPWTIEGERVLISTPNFSWEIQGMPINEAPQVLKKEGNTYIIYSASGSWTDKYCLGIITNKGENILKTDSWKKASNPVMAGSQKNNSFGIGHCSFFKSPDGKEDWIAYHGMSDGIGWEFRDVRAQKFTWDQNALPVFGEPASINIPIEVPSGQ